MKIEKIVAKVNDLQDGEMKEVSIDGKSVLLVRVDGEFHAIGSKCSHYGGPLAEGILSGHRVRCPWHQACFDVVTGELEEPPALDALPHFDLRIEDDNVIVSVPEDAEEQRVPNMVKVSAEPVTLEGNLGIPDEAEGIVLFAHGSGSSRFSPRNRFVAQTLREGGLATLLIDLLTSEEEEVDIRTRHLRFDIDLLASRLVGATDWLLENPDTKELNIGYFGSSTGAAAALIAATERSNTVDAIVSRGGRPDLAESILPQVKAPTLLIVGGNDALVIDLNQEALVQLHTEKKLEVIPGAGHLFEEPGALDKVARLARQWFRRYLTS